MPGKLIDFGFLRRRKSQLGRSILGRQVEATLCRGMTLPEPIEQLFRWIEFNNLFVDTEAGRIGFLFPEAAMKAGWTDNGRPGGTDIQFAAEGNVNMKYWFRSEDPATIDRLCVFAQTGHDGSMAAFWLDDDGSQKIVHLGSGSGSVSVCVLADDPVDFLRLLAIGYDEICWADEFADPPNSEADFVIGPNYAYQEWVSRSFGVTIPERGCEIVSEYPSMDDEESPDPFWRWVRENQQ